MIFKVDRQTPEQRVKELEQALADQQAEEARLRAENEKFRQLLENLHEVIYTLDPEGTVSEVSPNTEKITGYRPEEIIGCKYSDLMHPEDVPSQTAVFQEILNGAQLTTETRFVTRDGGYVWGMSRARPVFENGLVAGVQAAVVDITERRQAEEALKQSRDRYRLMVEAAGDLVFTVDQEGRFVYISPNCESVLGFPQETFQGKRFDAFVHPDDVDRIAGALLEVFEQFRRSDGSSVSRLTVDFRAATKAGGWKWLSARNTVVEEKDGALGLVCIARDIMDKKEAEKQLLESEQRYRFLVEESNDVIWTFDLTRMQFVYCSKSVERILGYLPEEANGATMDDIFFPEGKNTIVDAFGRVVAGKSDTDRVLMAINHRRKDGGAVWMEINAVLHRDESGRPVSFTGVSRDLSERKKAEQALRESEEKYRTILESMDEGYFEVDLAGNFTFVNDAMCRMLGYSRDELMGMNYKSYRTSENAREVFEAFNWVYRTGKTFKAFDRQLIRKDGSIVFVESSVSLKRDSDGSAVGFKGLARDITERKQAEQERERLQTQLRHAQQMEAIGTLAGGIAHDFNNILSSVIGYAELSIEEVAPDSQLHKNLSQVLAAGNRARDLVKRILAVSRREEQEFQPIPIVPLVKEAMKMLRSAIPASIEVREHISDRHLVVHADPTQVHQVIVNLVTNARHAMPEESGVLEVSVDPVCFGENARKPYPDMADAEYVHISVSDTGVGISDEYRDKIFEPYFTTRKEGTGTGLGLSVVHSIVSAHKGYITVESTPGAGSIFHVYLPTAERDRAPGPVQDAGLLPTGKESILLVDDEQPIVEIQTRHLESLGYRVTPRTSGVEALAAFRANPGKFDLLVTDMAMPNLTGDQLAMSIKEIRPNLPVIVCTGFSSRLENYRARQEVEGVLMKPVDKAEMARTIRNVLDYGGSPPPGS